MKILIIGVINSTNFGDPVLTECVRRLVSGKAPGAEIRLGDFDGGRMVSDIRAISYRNDVDFQSHLPSVARLKSRQLKYRFRTLLTKSGICDLEYRRQSRTLQRVLPSLREMLDWKPDLVIFAGGQIFSDRYGLQVAALIGLLQDRQIPVVLTSCGTGPGFSRRIRQELIRALNAPVVRFISVRDGLEKIRRWGIARPLYDSADTALWTGILYEQELSVAYAQNSPLRHADNISDYQDKFSHIRQTGDEDTAQNTLAEKNTDPTSISRRPVGIGVIYSMTTPVEKELRFLKRLTSYLDQNGVPWQFFGNGNMEDRCIAERALEKCVASEEDRAGHLASWPERPEDLIWLEAGFRGIISFRLHSHIIAASLGVPSVAIRWDDKLPGFFAKIGASERCLDISATPEVVWQTFLQAEKEGYDQKRLDSCRQWVSELLDLALRDSEKI
jgi:polysaccharide pyruvyl transferase WcaK-like protein